MLRISIGILLVCVLALGANALSVIAQPVNPWVQGLRPLKRRGAGISRCFLWAGSASSFIRGPNGFGAKARPRPGTGRRWLEADWVVVP